MMKKIKTIIIGLGNIGLKYDLNSYKKIILTHVKAATLNKNFNLVATIDKKNEVRKIFEKKYKLKSYKNLNEYLAINQNKKIDLVIISSPNTQHLKNVKESLIKLKPKIILCEKPFGNNLSDAKKIKKYCQKKKCKIFVNYTRLTDLQTKIISNKIKNHENIADVLYSKNIIINGSHFINLFLRLFGKLKSLIKKKDKIILKFKKGTVNLKKTSNFLKANTYQINNKDYKILVSRNLFKIYSRKKLIISKKIDKKNNYYVFKEIEKSFFNKKNKLCKVNEAIETQKIIKKINMLK